MDGFEKRKEQKKDSIRRAALELFQSYGFRKVSVNEIARKAGVSQVTIYNYYGSKDTLVQDVIKWFITGLLDKYLAVMASDQSFSEKLEEIVFDKSQVASQFQGELMVNYIQSNPEMQTYVEGLYMDKITPAIEGFFQQGTRQGYIDPKISIETIMNYLEIIRRGFYGTPELVERINTNPAMVKELIRLITYGLNG